MYIGREERLSAWVQQYHENNGNRAILTVTYLDLITEFDFLPNCARFP